MNQLNTSSQKNLATKKLNPSPDDNTVNELVDYHLLVLQLQKEMDELREDYSFVVTALKDHGIKVNVKNTLGVNNAAGSTK